MKNLIIRFLSGTVFVAVALVSLLAGKYLYAIFFALVLTGGLSEFYNFMKNSDIRPGKGTGIVTGIVLFGISFFVASGKLQAICYLIFLPFLLFFFVAELYREKKYPLENIAAGILGIVYVAFPISLSNFIVFSREGSYSPGLMIALLLLIWTYDSGAYLFGVTLGKHRLFERISPKKSWEGVIGGILVALAASWVISGTIPEIPLTDWIILTLLIVIASTFGDLSESLLKRQFGLKDSSQLIPGHGGLLDRFDSFLFAVPVFVCYLELVIR